jgi:hypothetical protein
MNMPASSPRLLQNIHLAFLNQRTILIACFATIKRLVLYRDTTVQDETAFPPWVLLETSFHLLHSGAIYLTNLSALLAPRIYFISKPKELFFVAPDTRDIHPLY